MNIHIESKWIVIGVIILIFIGLVYYGGYKQGVGDKVVIVDTLRLTDTITQIQPVYDTIFKPAIPLPPPSTNIATARLNLARNGYVVAGIALPSGMDIPAESYLFFPEYREPDPIVQFKENIVHRTDTLKTMDLKTGCLIGSGGLIIGISIPVILYFWNKLK